MGRKMLAWLWVKSEICKHVLLFQTRNGIHRGAPDYHVGNDLLFVVLGNDDAVYRLLGVLQGRSWTVS